MEKKLRIGVIGAGSFARAHLEGLKHYQNAETVAICDIDQKRVAECAAEYYIPDTYTDYKDLIARTDIDAVTLPLADQLHREVAVAALFSGKHVLCEKPMALNIEDCTAMVEAADKSGKELMIGQIGRYTPGFILAKKLIEEGEIGELFFVESEYAHDYAKNGGNGSWRVTPERHPIIGGGCHAVDLLRWIAGNPTEVFAYENHKVLKDWPINDCSIGIMKFPNDVMGKVFCSIGCKRAYTMRTVLYGTKGTIITDNTTPTVSIFKNEFAGNDMYRDTDQKTIEIKIPISINNHNTIAEVADFCDCIIDGRPVTTDGREGAATVAVCCGIVESAKTGEKIALNYHF